MRSSTTYKKEDSQEILDVKGLKSFNNIIG